MKRFAKSIFALGIAVLAFAACENKQEPVEEPVKYTLSGDNAFKDFKATVKVTADKAAPADVDVTVKGETNFPTGSITFDELIKVKKGDKEAQGEVVITNPDLLEPGKEYSITLTASVEKVNINGSITLSYTRPDLNGKWSVIGSLNGDTNWTKDYEMTAIEDGWYVVDNVLANTGEEFKFRRDGAWDINFGGNGKAGEEFAVTQDGPNIKIEADGLYTMSLNPNKAVAKFDIMPVAFIGNQGYGTISAAVEAAAVGDVISVNEGTYAEHIQLAKAVTLQGAGADKTFISSVEIYKAAATVKDLAINVVADERMATLAEVASGYQYTYGIFVHRAGYGATIDNVTINMENAQANATALFMVNNPEERGTTLDVVKNSTINGVAGKRNAQIYSAYAKLENNTISGGHKSYGIRIGNTNGSDPGYVELDKNSFKSAGSESAFAVQFNACIDQEILLGDNTQDDSFKSLYGASNEWFFANGNKINAIYGNGNELVKKSDGIATRAWGKYTSDGTWNSKFNERGEWDRSGTVTADKIYIAVAGANANQYGVAVYNRRTGEYEETITDGFEDGLFKTCAMTKMNGKIYVSNLARNGDAELKVYELDTENKKAEKILSAPTLGNRSNATLKVRLGDKMSSWYNAESKNGILGFTDYDGNEYIEFRMEGGTWDTSVHSSVSHFERNSETSQIGAFWPTEYEYGIAQGERHGLYCSNKEVNYRVTWAYGHVDQLYGGTGYWLSKDYGVESNMMDPKWFWYGDNKYLAYVSVTGDVSTPPTGYLKIVKMTGSSWLEQFQNIGTETVVQTFPLTSENDATVAGANNTNHTGYCDIYNDGEGNIYILGGITSGGITLVQMN